MTVARLLAAVAETDVGGPGTIAIGTTLLEAAEAGPVPAALVAFTVNVYVVPLVRPVTTSGLPGPEAVTPPGLEVAV